MYCDNCGHKNLDNGKFCEKCGKSLIEDSTEPTDRKPRKNFKVIYVVLFVLFIGEYFIYDSNNKLSSDISYIISSNNSIRNNISDIKEKRRQAERQSQSYSRSNSSVYITNWGYSFKTGDSIWGRNNVKLSNGSTIYTWLEKKTYGMKCYELFVQGSFHGGASNCSDSINNSWAASCGNSGQFWVQGNQSDVVKAIVQRCGN